MVRALARRQRRRLWTAFCLVLTVALAVSIWTAVQARDEAIRQAALGAELTAKAKLAPLLQPRDLMGPIVGERAEALGADLRRAITSVGPVDDVRVFSSIGRILYASDPRVVGTRPSYLREVTFQVATGDTRTLLRGGLLQTYVPIWLNPDGPVAVAELTQPLGPVTADATGPWYAMALIAAALVMGSLAMVVVTTRAGTTTSAPAPLYRSAVPRRPLRPATAIDVPMYEYPGFRAVEEQRRDAERRARAAEESFRSVQHQLKETLAQVKQLEGRLAMNETQNSTNDGELKALRDQLRDTSERLHQAELDNSALRERMALRAQELDEARQRMATVASREGTDLRIRLEEAEQRVAEMAHEIERLESELDYTRSKFHMTKLSEALREFDNDDLEIQEQDDLYEHPVIIRNRQGQSKTQRVR